MFKLLVSFPSRIQNFVLFKKQILSHELFFFLHFNLSHELKRLDGILAATCCHNDIHYSESTLYSCCEKNGWLFFRMALQRQTCLKVG